MNPTVLIVAEDAEVRNSMGRVLRAEHYEVETVADAEAARTRVNPERIQLLLLDASVPGRNEWDFFRQVTGWHTQMPVVIIAEAGCRDPKPPGAGVAAVLEKPLEAPVLLRTIAAAVGDPNHMAPTGPAGGAAPRTGAPGLMHRSAPALARSGHHAPDCL